MVNHRNVETTAWASADAMEISQKDTVVSYLPLCHVAEQIFSLYLPLFVGNTANFAESFATIQNDLREIAPTVFLGVPRIWEFNMADADQIISHSTSSIDLGHVHIGAQINDHAAFLAGVSSKTFFTDAQLFTQTQLLITEYYQLDTLSNFWDVYNVETEALGQKIIYHPVGLPDIDRTKPLIANPSDLDHIYPPDPYKSGRLPWVHNDCGTNLEKT